MSEVRARKTRIARVIQRLMCSIDAVLFDLDDTLLGNNMDIFLAHYFPAISEYFKPYIKQQEFLKELLYSTRAMIENTDKNITNREVFWSVFCERTGIEREIIEPAVSEFYREDFAKLVSTTERRAVAKELVQFCFDQDWSVVIATNPLFPLQAIEHRLEWAGVPADVFQYGLITAYENMHATKPSLTYYEEILDSIGVRSDRAIMVGDDWENDIVPANKVGLLTYWISNGVNDPPDNDVPLVGLGSLEGFYRRLSNGLLVDFGG